MPDRLHRFVALFENTGLIVYTIVMLALAALLWLAYLGRSGDQE